MDWPPLDPAIIAPFLMAMVLVELTPGPNMGWLALVSLSRGRTAGLAAVAGITVGLAAWLAAALLGLSTFVLTYPAVHAVIRWAGVAFLLWLAWEAWRGEGPADPAEPEATRRALFLRGMVGNLLNPKAAVFYVALLPTFIRPGYATPLSQALILGGLHLAIAVVVHSLVVFSAAGAGRALTERMQGPRARAAMAAGLVLIAAWMAWQTRG
ncbi:LysE family translocator [Brevundimonas sp.]|uniref:LysE family translocator n=1 Tax=Brevundimonas sp. TaxID=1871086 RepID=UPI003918EE16